MCVGVGGLWVVRGVMWQTGVVVADRAPFWVSFAGALTLILVPLCCGSWGCVDDPLVLALTSFGRVSFPNMGSVCMLTRGHGQGHGQHPDSMTVHFSLFCLSINSLCKINCYTLFRNWQMLTHYNVSLHIECVGGQAIQHE